MNLITLASIFFVTMVASATETTDHDKVLPILQPEPVTVSEKAAILFKPQLHTSRYVCVSFPAVSAAGEVTGGLKPTNGNDACEYAPKGSQVYGRAGWYKDLWAIMYAWYFPKGIASDGTSPRRHGWKSVVVWINNPEVATPKIVGVSMSKPDFKYRKQIKMRPNYFAGYRSVDNTDIYGSNTSLRFAYELLFDTYLYFGDVDGEYQDLVMWEQLTDAARGALNDNNNFGEAEVPLNEGNYEKHLENAWPL